MTQQSERRTIVKIRVFKTWESCERTTYYVELLTDEGFTMTPCGHATGSVYTDHKGLSKDEARDRALCDAAEWGDFLGIEPEPFEEDGEVHTTSFKLQTYTTRRKLAERGDHTKDNPQRAAGEKE